VREIPPPPPPAVPAAVTQRQLRLALLAGGSPTPDEVRAAIEALPDPVMRAGALIEWDHAQSIQRQHPLIAQLAAAFGKDDAWIDDLFREAATY